MSEASITPSLPDARHEAGVGSGGGTVPRVGAATATRRLTGLVLLIGLVVAGFVASLAVGTKSISFWVVLEAFFDRDPDELDHLIVRELRQPRTLLGLTIGAGFGAAGALMQAVTRNPLADPGLLGVNAGASFAVVVGIWLFDVTAASTLVWFALLGAGVAAIAVYVLGTAGRAGATPVRLALAGAALAALLFALTRAVVLMDQEALDQYRFWAVGSLAGRSDDLAGQVAPFIIVGLVMAVAVSRQLNTVAMGDDAARALGTKLGRLRLASVGAITLLCGASVAAAGPVAFVGLVVPHAARTWFGPDERWLIPASALGGSALLLICDTLGRVVARPGEIQVGIMTAVLGGPAFIFLVRRTRMAQL